MRPSPAAAAPARTTIVPAAVINPNVAAPAPVGGINPNTAADSISIPQTNGPRLPQIQPQGRAAPNVSQGRENPPWPDRR